ncbi:hypothetical protein UlMin_016693, partial [Ulmus minor]
YFQFLRRARMRVISKSEAPLKETELKVMLELMGKEYDNERPGLDLVTVLDLSGSMKGERLEKMKISMQLVIKKLSPIDCLSVMLDEFGNGQMWQRDLRDRIILQPTPAAAIDMLPTVAYSDNTSTSFAEKFVHTSFNKNRCSINQVL